MPVRPYRPLPLGPPDYLTLGVNGRFVHLEDQIGLRNLLVASAPVPRVPSPKVEGILLAASSIRDSMALLRIML